MELKEAANSSSNREKLSMKAVHTPDTHQTHNRHTTDRHTPLPVLVLISASPFDQTKPCIIQTVISFFLPFLFLAFWCSEIRAEKTREKLPEWKKADR